ncbi:CHASE3 domain-containing protein [Rubrolithibacter danxiaensis]|uniref:CHASE3 domain-containing protein n=1 Tax=Rubrolithibacter danxiaensis TaxID=3390805 RepID=UPI003BF8FC1B
MKKSFIKTLHTAFLISIILLLATFLISFISILKAHKRAEWVHHTHTVLENLEKIISNMKDAETGVRGYLYTKDIQLLDPYNNSFERTLNNLNKIKALTADNAEQQHEIPALTKAIKAKFHLLEAQVALNKSGRLVPVDIVKQGKNVMDHIREIINRMQQREELLLEERSSNWKQLSAITPFLIILIAIIAIITTYYFCKNLKITYYKKTLLQQQLQREKIETSKRISILQGVTNQVALGNYQIRLEESEKDLLGILAGNLNRMTNALEHSFNTIKELMKKKDDFISIAAHELKTPVTSIKAYLQFIGRARLESNEGKIIYPFITKANNQINRLIHIIKDLLDVSRINEGNLQLKKEHFSIRELILNVSEEIFMSAKTHEIILEGDPDIQLKADRFRIEQVLNNLISNAVKYSPTKTEIIIKVQELEQVAKVSVTDFGIGIPKEKIPYIFNRYFRVEESSQNYSGMGLGLYISKGIIEKHGGNMGVESTEGEKTTFWFTLPL